MNDARLIAVALHYLTMLILLFTVLLGLRTAIGGMSFWIELAIIIGIAYLYRPAVRALGVAPPTWETE